MTYCQDGTEGGGIFVVEVVVVVYPVGRGAGLAGGGVFCIRSVDDWGDGVEVVSPGAQVDDELPDATQLVVPVRT